MSLYSKLYDFYTTDRLITKLSIALLITDSFTGKVVSNAIKVSILENSKTAYRNLSGYFIFTDLENGIYSVIIESELFFSITKQINISSLDPKNPLVFIQLIPKPSYPFPENSTLIRGSVNSANGSAENASIKVIGKQIETVTDENGEFALFFKNVKQEQVQINIQKGGDTKIVSSEVFEGKTVYTGKIQFP